MDIAQKKDRLVFILTILLVFFIGYKIISKIIQEKITSLTAQIETEENRNKILGTVAVLDRKLLAYQEKAFSTTEITQFVDKISQLAKEADIEIETISSQPVLFREQLVELSVRIPLHCTYHQLGKFFSLIESNRELIWVKQLRIKKDTVPQAEQDGRVEINLTLSGFNLKK